MATDPGRSIDPGYPADAPTLPAVFQTLAEAKQESRFRAQELSPGARIGHYEIQGPLGRGGVSAVYSARHLYLRQEVALKTLNPDISGREVSERFLREAQALAVLANPHVIRVYDAGLWQDMPYIVLEKIDGKDLRDLLVSRGPLSAGRAMDLLEELGHVLVLQEDRGILHRDIKPGNILLRGDGSFCLLDYGLVGRSKEGDSAARKTLAAWDTVTEDGQFFGTPLYMAPEQFNGMADHRTDMFLLGMTAWECLAGRPARDSSRSDLSGLWTAAQEPVPPVRSVRDDVPEPLEEVLAGLVAIKPAERYGSAAEFLHDLEAFRYQGQAPTGSTRGNVFVAMSYAADYDAVYRSIDRACREARLRPRRMDQLVFVKDIWNQIVQEIEACAIVIADFSIAPGERWPNPNVLTEAAHARAVDKALIILSQNAPEQLPFDWRHMPILRYTTDPHGLEGLAEQLTTKLRHASLGALH